MVVDDVGVLSGARDDEATAMADVLRRLRAAGLLDDLRRNVLGAVTAGMTGVHQLRPDSTLEELEVLTELPLRPV